MKYMGSKRRIAKYILPIMLNEAKDGQSFYDMFTGGGELVCQVPDNLNRFAIDINSIPALSLIKNRLDLIPQNNDEFTEYDYDSLKKHKYDKTLDDSLLCYVGYSLSYGGKYFGGWRRDKKGKRDYVAEAYRNAQKQSEKLKNVTLYHCSYDDFLLNPNSIIYNDPPYQNATKYTGNFNHDKFWQWCREKTNEGHQVFISEYNAPDDFECLWSKEIVSSLTKDTGSKKGIEKLFTYKKNDD